MPSSLVQTPHCRFCGSTAGEIVLDAGHQPASDLFPLATDPGPDPVHPLRMWLCAGCHLAQLVEDPTVPEEPRGQEPEAWLRQAEQAVDALAEAGYLTPGSVVVEYGSPHGGGWLDLVVGKGLVEGTHEDQADVIIDNIGMMHDRDQLAALRERVDRLRPDGVLFFQYHSFATIVEHGQWNALRHGHYAYYSTPSLIGMLETLGLSPVTAYWYPLYGGTVLLGARRGGIADERVAEIVDAEIKAGVLDVEAARGLQRAYVRSSEALLDLVTTERTAGNTVVGYSAASRAVALLCSAGIGPELMPLVGDASQAKEGRRMPGSAIPVAGPEAMAATRPDVVVLFVPDLLDEVRRALPQIEAAGGRWVVAEELRA